MITSITVGTSGGAVHSGGTIGRAGHTGTPIGAADAQRSPCEPARDVLRRGGLPSKLVRRQSELDREVVELVEAAVEAARLVEGLLVREGPDSRALARALV